MRKQFRDPEKLRVSHSRGFGHKWSWEKKKNSNDLVPAKQILAGLPSVPATIPRFDPRHKVSSDDRVVWTIAAIRTEEFRVTSDPKVHEAIYIQVLPPSNSSNSHTSNKIDISTHVSFARDRSFRAPFLCKFFPVWNQKKSSDSRRQSNQYYQYVIRVCSYRNIVAPAIKQKALVQYNISS